ncbi:hypothetical protein [Erythrobacter donghaensis]|uniref:hypothetical protein n=1 Tax=Erythrobacter donghaensis TaxID=267135 RepID=UPI0013021474|nr:hypothetical protein [Erythrobacter donghaensis]
MTTTGKALIWAVAIIAAAFVMRALGMSDGASFAVIAGLTGAAWASLNSEKGCGRSCWQ